MHYLIEEDILLMSESGGRTRLVSTQNGTCSPHYAGDGSFASCNCKIPARFQQIDPPVFKGMTLRVWSSTEATNRI